LQAKPISSYLVGWDFPVNPAQFGASIAPKATGPNKSYYAWDQTIVFQSATSAITISRETTVGAFTLTAGVSTQMAIIQYLDGAEAQQVLLQATIGGLSVNVLAEITTVQQVTVSLWWTANPVGTGMTTGDSLVTALDANGHPSVTAGWAEIKLASNLGNATFTSLGTTSTQEIGFSNFADNNAYRTGKSFAIVVGFSTAAPGAIVEIDSISLVPGKIPTIPAPKTSDEVLRQCQKYFETSYGPGGVNNAIPPVGTVSLVGCECAPMTSYLLSGTLISRSNGFGLSFKTPKRANPSLVFYDGLNGNSNAAQAYIRSPSFIAQGSINFGANFINLTVTNKSFSYMGLGTVQLSGLSATEGAAVILYQFSADARLGVVA